MSSVHSTFIFTILHLFLLFSSSIAQPPPSPHAQPPPSPYAPPPPSPYASSPSPYASSTFDFVNAGPFSTIPYLHGEYESTYRELHVSRSDFVMSLCFYNTTPDSYTLALGIDPRHWVWAANPTDPVRKGAKLSLKEDGNLVLVDFDGRLVWQTNTSNLGVMGIETRIYDQYGNMVLYDGNHNPVWQSFDHPTDTLFPNQVLRSTTPKKLVSRISSLGGVHSLVMMPTRLSLYYKSANSTKPVVYYTMFKTNKTLDNVQFVGYKVFKLSFDQHFSDGTQDRYEVADLTPPANYHYETITSFIRLENDGNLKIYVYQIDDEIEGWFPSLSVFTQDRVPDRTHQVDSCLLPEKCGAFGVCENGTCVGCPSPQGLLPWTAGKCEPPKLGACSLGKLVSKYYKVQGVEHFSSEYNKREGQMVLAKCQSKCSLDCQCKGYFYHLENSRCWITYDLMTLTKSGNPKHFGFIKTPN